MLKHLLIFLLLISVHSLYSQSKAKRGTITVKRNPDFEFDRGEGLFTKHCNFCHMPYYYSHEQRIFINVLADATKKHDMSWLTKLLRFPGQLAKAGDPEMIAINKKVKYNFVRYNNYPSMNHPDYHILDNGQVNAIFFYIDSLNRRKLAWKEKSDER